MMEYHWMKHGVMILLISVYKKFYQNTCIEYDQKTFFCLTLITGQISQLLERFRSYKLVYTEVFNMFNLIMIILGLTDTYTNVYL